MRINRVAATVAVLSVAVIPATALASAKKGVWIQSTQTGQTYLQTSTTKVKTMQFSCQNPAGGQPSTAVLTGLKISSKGKVSKTANATINGLYSKTKTKVSVKISFSSKAKGTVKSLDGACNPVSFSAKYLGVNPQG